MANFSLYIPLLLQVEGGYQAHPDDPGNYNSLGQNVGTNKGISARFYEDIIKRPPTVADMLAITTQEAQKLYKTHFWDACKGNEINSQAKANTIVDHHVNSGRGVRLAQEVLNKNFNKKLSIDNKMGPATLSAINSVHESQFVPAYNDARAAYYKSIGNQSFYKGWLERLKKFAIDTKALAIENKNIIGIGLVALSTLFFLRGYGRKK